jgi:hypothetical protein
MNEPDKKITVDIGNVIQSLADAFDNNLFAKSQEQLEEHWFFNLDPAGSLEVNIYTFYDRLRLYADICRRWEEHHNGPLCVVERVRDQYLWPKIKRFAGDLRGMIAANAGHEASRASRDSLRALVRSSIP